MAFSTRCHWFSIDSLRWRDEDNWLNMIKQLASTAWHGTRIRGLFATTSTGRELDSRSFWRVCSRGHLLSYVEVEGESGPDSDTCWSAAGVFWRCPHVTYYTHWDVYIYIYYKYKYPYIDSMLFRHDMGHVAESQAELAGPVQATLCHNKTSFSCTAVACICHQLTWCYLDSN